MSREVMLRALEALEAAPLSWQAPTVMEALRAELAKPDDKAQPVVIPAERNIAAWWKWFNGSDKPTVEPASTFLVEDALATGWRPLVFGDAATQPPAEQGADLTSRGLTEQQHKDFLRQFDEERKRGAELSDEEIWAMWEFPQHATDDPVGPLSWKEAAIRLARKSIAADRKARGGAA